MNLYEAVLELERVSKPVPEDKIKEIARELAMRIDVAAMQDRIALEADSILRGNQQ